MHQQDEPDAERLHRPDMTDLEFMIDRWQQAAQDTGIKLAEQFAALVAPPWPEREVKAAEITCERCGKLVFARAEYVIGPKASATLGAEVARAFAQRLAEIAGRGLCGGGNA